MNGGSESGPLKALVVLGTRPEAIKLAPVVLSLSDDPRFSVAVVNTGQHRHMVEPVLDAFDLVADHDLAIGGAGQTLADITARALTGLDRLVADHRPDVVIVQGDTSSCFAGALAAFYHQVPVAHVEAGLRTGDRYAPFPEELNRRMTASLASLHLAPTLGNVANLLSEGLSRRDIVCTGNTVIDALRITLAKGGEPPDPGVAEALQAGRPLVLVTVHRRESWGAPLARIAGAVAGIARAHPGVTVVLPAHPNPAVRSALEPLHAEANVRIVEPLDYRSFALALARSALVLTDSGGIQEEAPSLGVPVLVLREVTERPEALAAGLVEIVGTDAGRIERRAAELLAMGLLGTGLPASVRQRDTAATPEIRPNPYGDGRAAARSVAAIAHLLGCGPPPDEFAGLAAPPA